MIDRRVRRRVSIECSALPAIGTGHLQATFKSCPCEGEPDLVDPHNGVSFRAERAEGGACGAVMRRVKGASGRRCVDNAQAAPACCIIGWFSRQQPLLSSVHLQREDGDKAVEGVVEIEHLEVVASGPELEEAPKASDRVRQGRRHRGAQPAPGPEDLEIAAGGRAPVDPADPPFIPPEVVAAHNNSDDGFCGSFLLLKRLQYHTLTGCPFRSGIIVEDRVYDCTQFLDLHPGGPEVFTQVRKPFENLMSRS